MALFRRIFRLLFADRTRSQSRCCDSIPAQVEGLEDRVLLTQTIGPVFNASVAGTMIVDDGDAGFSTVGTWNQSTNPNGRDGDVSNSMLGSGQNVARWEFTGLTPGNYRVSATWPEHPNRATNSPFTALDSIGGTVLNSTVVDQEQAPSEFTDDGSLWDDLFIISVTGSTLVVELSNAADQYVIADAIRIEPTLDPPSPVALIIDDGDSGFVTSGTWATSLVGNGRENDLRNHTAGSGSETATWTFTDLTAGNYLVSATWFAHQNRATNAQFSMRDGTGGPLLELTAVNQELTPDDRFDRGSAWEDLAVVSITGSELVVELSDAANQFVVADAIRIESTELQPLLPGTIIDNGDAGFATTVGWTPTSSVLGHDGDLLNSQRGSGSSVATWTFDDLLPGEYRVSATWYAHANRAKDAPFTISDGAAGNELITVDVNQEMAPDDFTTFGSGWEDLAIVTITGNQLVVELTDDADQYVIADAIRVQRTTPLPPPAYPITIDGNFSDWADVPTYTDPVDDQHDTNHDQAGETPGYVDHPDVDLLTYKVTHDAENFYFYFEATGEIGRTQVEDDANGLDAGRYYVIVTIDVDNDDTTGYPLYEGGYYTGTTDTTGYDANGELEFYNGELNTGHYLQHGARDEAELEQAFADQSNGQYVYFSEDGPEIQGPFMPGFVNVLPGTYDYYTQWSYEENDPDLGGNDSITFVLDKGPIVPGIVTQARSLDNHQIEMKVPFKGFLKDAAGNPIVGLGMTVDLSFSLEASGELSNEIPPDTWASDTGEPINGYVLTPVTS